MKDAYKQLLEENRRAYHDRDEEAHEAAHYDEHGHHTGRMADHVNDLHQTFESLHNSISKNHGYSGKSAKKDYLGYGVSDEHKAKSKQLIDALQDHMNSMIHHANEHCRYKGVKYD